MAAAKASAALGTDGVDLVDEHDAGRVALGLLEEVADAGCPYAHEHLDELRRAQAEEGYPRLTGHGAGEQGLAGARRAKEQDALRDPRTQRGKLLGILQELDDLLQLLLGLVYAGHVGERDCWRVERDHARPA